MTADRAIPTVFLNCPYDTEYEPVLDAIVFTCVCCGFLPRSAIDSGSSGTSRIDRIKAALRACQYSVHDRSRCRGEGEDNLARLNMPVELGMAMMLAELEGHEWMALAPLGAEYSHFVSDLRGYDLERHDGNPRTVVRHVANWLSTRESATTVVTPKEIADALPSYRRAKLLLRGKWLGPPPWPELVKAARRVIDSP